MSQDILIRLGGSCRLRSRSPRSQRILLMAAMLVTSQLVIGCGDPVGQAVAELTRARNQIRDSTKTADAIAASLQESLPKEIQRTIEIELQALVQNSIGAAGVEARCGVQHVRDTLANSIQRMIDKLKTPSSPRVDPTPVICRAYPNKIPFRHLARNLVYAIDVYGYELRTDAKADRPISVFVRDSSGNETRVEGMLHTTSTFQAVLNLGENGVPISAQTDAIVLRADGMPDTTIPVIRLRPEIKQALLRNCRQEIRCTGRLQYYGDQQFDGHGPCWFEFIAELHHNAETNKIESRIHMACAECNEDWTGHGDISWCLGWSDWIPQMPAPIPGRFLRFLSEVRQGPPGDTEEVVSKYHLQRNRCEHGCTAELGDGGVVNRYEYWGDTGGKDDRTAHTRAIAHFNPIIYEYESLDDTVTTEDWALLKQLEPGDWEDLSGDVSLRDLRRSRR